jgi:hypothetical protein
MKNTEDVNASAPGSGSALDVNYRHELNEPNPPPRIPLDDLAAQAPVAVCSKCGRKSWTHAHAFSAWWRCGMTQPSGEECRGVWVPLDALPDDLERLRHDYPARLAEKNQLAKDLQRADARIAEMEMPNDQALRLRGITEDNQSE